MSTGETRRPFWEPYLPAFLEIRDIVRLSTGFVLLPVEMDGPDVAHELRDWMKRRGHPSVAFEPTTNDAWRTLAERLAATEVDPNGFAMVIGSRRPLDAHEQGIREVNFQRDRLAGRLRRPLLWIGPSSFLARMQTLAPDLWSFATLVQRIRSAAPMALPVKQTFSLDKLESDVRAAKGAGDLLLWAALCVECGRKLAANGDHSRALLVLSDAIETIEPRVIALSAEDELTSRLRPLWHDALLRRARCYRELEDGISAGTDLGLLFGQPSLPSATRARALLILGRIQDDAGRWKEAETAHRRALAIARALGDADESLEVQAQAHIGIASALVASGQPGRQDEADDELQRAIRICEEIDAPELRAAAYALLGKAYASARREGDAQDAIDEAFRIEQSLQPPSRLEVLNEIRAATEALGSAPPSGALPPEGSLQDADQLFDPLWYVPRPLDERRILDQLEHPGATIGVWGPLKVGKTTLVQRVISELQGQDALASRQSTLAWLDMAKIKSNCADALVERRTSDFFRLVAEGLCRSVGMESVPPMAPDESEPSAMLTRLLEDHVLPRASSRFLLVVDRADETREESFHDDFLMLLRHWADRARKYDELASLRLVLTFRTAPSLLNYSIDASPVTNVALLQEVEDLSSPQVEALAARYRISLSSLELGAIQHWIGGHAWMVRRLLYDARKEQLSVSELCNEVALSRSFKDFLNDLRMLLPDLLSPKSPRRESEQLMQPIRLLARSPDGANYHDAHILKLYDTLRPAGLFRREGDRVLFRYEIIRAAVASGKLG